MLIVNMVVLMMESVLKTIKSVNTANNLFESSCQLLHGLPFLLLRISAESTA